MQVHEIPIQEVQVPEVRVTNVMAEDIANEFASSVAGLGVLQPILVIRENGRYVLVDGYHRLVEARAAGHATIPAVVKDGSLEDVIVQNLLTSVARGRPKASDMRRVVRLMEDEFGWDMVAIRQKTRLSQDYVEKLAWVNRAVPAVQEALDEEQISLTHAYHIARIEWPEVQERVIANQLTYGWNVADLRRHIRLVEAIRRGEIEPPPPPEPASPGQVRCHYCKDLFAAEDMTSPVVCPRCDGLAYEAASGRRALVTAPD